MISINGIGYPIFKIFNGVTLIDTVELPLTGAAGLVEVAEEKSIQHELITYKTVKNIKGWIIHFKLSYSQYTDNTTTQKIINLLNYEKNGYTIQLTPRSDNLGRYFNVTGENSAVSIGVLKGGIGNRLLELNYRTTELVENLDGIRIYDEPIITDFENLIII